MDASLHRLLVHVDDSPAAAARLTVARRLATQHGSDVVGLYAVTPSIVALPLAAEGGAAAVEALREADEERAAAARRNFDGANDSPGVRARWAEVTGLPVLPAFCEQALYADLLVLGQHDAQRAAIGEPADFVESVLAASGKPAIVVPSVGAVRRMGERIAVAWKPTRESARALAAAVPLMQGARRVDILQWGESEPPPVRGARLGIEDYLVRRGITPTWHREAGAEPELVGDLMLSRACDLDADLLVMGCYGHGRAREWVLGGASRTVMRSMTLPVLMAH